MTERKLYPLMISGGGPSTGRLTVTSPYDGSEIAEVETVGEAHVKKALATAVNLYQDRAKWLPVHRRIEILDRAAEIMAGQHESLAAGAAREGGKPLIDSRVEVTRAIDGVKLCVEVLRSEQGHVIPMGGTAAGSEPDEFNGEWKRVSYFEPGDVSVCDDCR